MSSDLCVICQKGRITRCTEEIAFSQWTLKGYIVCHTVIRMNICNKCGSKTWDHASEALLDEAVFREYQKLFA